jgi:hypothetical protein
VPADGFAPGFDLIKMLNLLLDGPNRLLQRQQGVLGQWGPIALPYAESARHTVRRFDVKFGRLVIVIPNNHNVLPIPREGTFFSSRIWCTGNSICSRVEYNLTTCRRPDTPVPLTLRSLFVIRQYGSPASEARMTGKSEQLSFAESSAPSTKSAILCSE